MSSESVSAGPGCEVCNGTLHVIVPSAEAVTAFLQLRRTNYWETASTQAVKLLLMATLALVQIHMQTMGSSSADDAGTSPVIAVDSVLVELLVPLFLRPVGRIEAVLLVPLLQVLPLRYDMGPCTPLCRQRTKQLLEECFQTGREAAVVNVGVGANSNVNHGFQFC